MNVFLSYAHADTSWKIRIKSRLDAVRDLEIWEDNSIESGEMWDNKIKEKLSELAGCIVLVSPRYLNSKYIVDNELPELLRIKDNSQKFWWILVDDAFYEDHGIDQIECLNINSALQSLVGEEAQNREIMRIVRVIAKQIHSFKTCPWETDLAKFDNLPNDSWWYEFITGGISKTVLALKSNVPAAGIPPGQAKTTNISKLADDIPRRLGKHTFSFKYGQAIVRDANEIIVGYYGENSASREIVEQFWDTNIVDAWHRVILDADQRGLISLVGLFLSTFARGDNMASVADGSIRRLLLTGGGPRV